MFIIFGGSQVKMLAELGDNRGIGGRQGEANMAQVDIGASC